MHWAWTRRAGPQYFAVHSCGQGDGVQCATYCSASITLNLTKSRRPRHSRQTHTRFIWTRTAASISGVRVQPIKAPTLNVAAYPNSASAVLLLLVWGQLLRLINILCQGGLLMRTALQPKQPQALRLLRLQRGQLVQRLRLRQKKSRHH